MKQRSLKFLAMLYRNHESHEYANLADILVSFNAIRVTRPLVTEESPNFQLHHQATKTRKEYR